MKLLIILFVAAASAVTVLPNEDSMAMESQPRQQQERQQRANRTYMDKKRIQNQSQNQADQYKSTTNHREHSGEPANIRKYREQQSIESQKYQQEENFGGVPTYLQYQNGGHKLGYSSFVQHQGDESEATKDNMEIKKLVPKSSVQVEMYHETGHQKPQLLNPPLPNQVQQKEASQAKLKNRPPKFYHEALANLKKGKSPTQSIPSSTPTIIVRELPTSTTPSYSIHAPTKYRTTVPTPKRKPLHERPEKHNINLFQVSEPHQNYRPERNPYGHSQQISANHQPVLHIQSQSHGHTSILDTKSPRWKALSETVEIATSEEFKPKTTKTRKPKEISEEIFSSHSQYFDTEPERFKAERFDHEKALRESQPFNVNNVMFGQSHIPGFGEEEVKQTTLDGGSAFHIAHGFDIAKAVQANMIGAAKGPITFGAHNTRSRIPKKNTINAGGLEFPVMTEEEFEKNFGKFQVKRPEFKFRPGNRIPFDARGQQNQLSPYHHQQPSAGLSNYASDYPQFNAKSPNNNVDVFPSLSYSLPSKKSNPTEPHRQGKVLAVDNREPQQFSVSASYQIDRSNRE